jgi:radical SAM superfamily enzyme YgiQ (UPF0313 family)
MADIALINPRFEPSYWGIEHALPLFGKRANLPAACLPLLAALTPPGNNVALVDENVQPIDFDRVARADLVGLTGMNVQRRRMREVLTELKHRGAFTVVGGPWVSVHEDYFGDLADVIFVGEAEETWPRFLSDWKQGRHQRRYEQNDKTDMTRVPVPRYDLLDMRDYLFGSVQFSRGCPFQCEFCDIIVTFGRRPRLKTSGQVIAELEALRARKMEIVFIVDDNLIGNKKGIKPLLQDVAAWQKANGYPMTFFTEASLDLADDAELLGYMVEANIQTVYVGIETTNEESLRETKKLQNIRAGQSILERVQTIQQAGLEVWCGMIVGFDHDRPEVFEAHRRFAADARIIHVMIAMLTAIPKTPLYRRLEAEGRVDPTESELGSNIIPIGMTRQEMRDGFVRLMRELYEPEAYFQRFEDLYLKGKFRFGQAQRRYWCRHPWAGLCSQALHLVRAGVLCLRLMGRIPQKELRDEYRRRLWRLVRSRPDPNVLFIFAIKCAAHYHHYRMAVEMNEGRSAVVNPF